MIKLFSSENQLEPPKPRPAKPPKTVRDMNYYFGLLLLTAGILSLGVYLLMDKTGLFNAFFSPISFLITFLICAWGFVLLWKSDTDYRFKLAQNKIKELEDELAFIKKLM
ncbi:MAG TPA: hypothetical protein VHY08_07165 [Bacillota bacterium]|nr:hypothetical protein [Bacillota bacterium]